MYVCIYYMCIFFFLYVCLVYIYRYIQDTHLERWFCGHYILHVYLYLVTIFVRLGLLEHLEARTDAVHQRNPAVNVSHHVALTPLWCHDGVRD